MFYLFPWWYSSSGSTTVGAFLAGSGTAGLSSLPLLNVTTTLNSSILALGSLAEPISCIPLGFFCVWEGNFPFLGPCCWLDNLEWNFASCYIWWRSQNAYCLFSC